MDGIIFSGTQPDCSDLSHLLYVEKLRTLRLPSLYYRWRRGDMTQAYQVIHRGVDIESANFPVCENMHQGH